MHNKHTLCMIAHIVLLMHTHHVPKSRALFLPLLHLMSALSTQTRMVSCLSHYTLSPEAYSNRLPRSRVMAPLPFLLPPLLLLLRMALLLNNNHLPLPLIMASLKHTHQPAHPHTHFRMHITMHTLIHTHSQWLSFRPISSRQQTQPQLLSQLWC